MIGVSISQRGGVQAVRTIQDVNYRANNASPAWDRVHEYMVQISKRQFDGGGSRGPNKWARLDPNTIARKRRGGYRTKKMHRTENLVHSLVNPGDPSHVWNSDDDSAVFGSRTQAFAVQQAGTDKLPFRPPVDPTDTDVRKITILIADYVMGSRSKSVVL